MAKPKSVKPRKQPAQQRSRQMMSDILEGAARVLSEEGLSGFNTNRVAEDIREPELSQWAHTCSEMLCNYLESPPSQRVELLPIHS